MSLQHVPLMLALKHLRVEWNDEDIGQEDRLRQRCRLMQNDTEIPPASDVAVHAFLHQQCDGSLPEEFEIQMLEMILPEWPNDLHITFHGITTFGAGSLANANRCAHHVLASQPDCTLARQLLSLLRARSDVRCPFGAEATGAPNVAAIISSDS